jgi:hypothetical protein
MSKVNGYVTADETEDRAALGAEATDEELNQAVR